MSEYRILLVDDEPSIGTLVAEILALEGWMVETAESAEAGLKMARDLSPDLVLFDYRLPDMDGSEFYRRLRQSNVVCPAVLFSAWGRGEAVASEMSVGFVRKPCDIDALVNGIEDAIALHRTLPAVSTK